MKRKSSNCLFSVQNSKTFHLYDLNQRKAATPHILEAGTRERLTFLLGNLQKKNVLTTDLSINPLCVQRLYLV